MAKDEASGASGGNSMDESRDQARRGQETEERVCGGLSSVKNGSMRLRMEANIVGTKERGL